MAEVAPPQSAYKRGLARLNTGFAKSYLGKYFNVEGRNTTLLTEFRAGTATFLAMSYILAVNAAILTDSGGPCSVKDCLPENQGIPGGVCKFFDPGYEKCLDETKRSLVTATAATSLIADFLMGAGANMPLAIAPGMGMNAYFAYTVVGYRGTGLLTYQQTLAANFIEGWIFVFLAVSGVRGAVVANIPRGVMLATTIGLGLFLTHIGLQSSEGLGIVTYDPATLVTLGGCPYADRLPSYSPVASALADQICTYNATTGVVGDTICSYTDKGGLKADTLFLGPASPNTQCMTNKMRSPTMWLGIFGGGVMALMFVFQVPAAILFGIVFVTIISWIPTSSNKAAYIGKYSSIPRGQDRMDYFVKVATVPNVSKTALQLDFTAFDQAKTWSVVFVFLYVDFLDCTGTLASLSLQMNRFIPGFVDENGVFPRQIIAFTVDGMAAWIGALMGTSPATTYAESAVGINEGGRTGITALTTGFWFFICLFFTPIFASIPPYATGPALIMCGVLMMANSAKINWTNFAEAVPAFLTLVLMPLTYSIADGVIAGLAAHIFLYWFVWARKYYIIKKRNMSLAEAGLWPYGKKYTMASDEEFFDDSLQPAAVKVLSKTDTV